MPVFSSILVTDQAGNSAASASVETMPGAESIRWRVWRPALQPLSSLYAKKAFASDTYTALEGLDQIPQQIVDTVWHEPNMRGDTM